MKGSVSSLKFFCSTYSACKGLIGFIIMGMMNIASASICPGEEAGSPQLPSIVRTEIFNPANSNKPHPGNAQISADRRSLIGGSVEDGELNLLLTLSQAIPAGCSIKIDVYDLAATEAELLAGAPNAYKNTRQVFIFSHPGILGRNELEAAGNSTNKVSFSFSLFGRVSTSKVYNLKVRLYSTFSTREFPPSAGVPFSFENRPFEIISLTSEKNEISSGQQSAFTSILNALPSPNSDIKLLYTSSNKDAGRFVGQAEVTSVDGVVAGKPTDRTSFLANKLPITKSKETSIGDAATKLRKTSSEDVSTKLVKNNIGGVPALAGRPTTENASTTITVKLRDYFENLSDPKTVSIVVKNVN
jgi:hypothetical protein